MGHHEFLEKIYNDECCNFFITKYNPYNQDDLLLAYSLACEGIEANANHHSHLAFNDVVLSSPLSYSST